MMYKELVTINRILKTMINKHATEATRLYEELKAIFAPKLRQLEEDMNDNKIIGFNRINKFYQHTDLQHILCRELLQTLEELNESIESGRLADDDEVILRPEYVKELTNTVDEFWARIKSLDKCRY